MSFDRSARDFLKRTYACLTDEALPPNSPLYEPIYQRLDLDDPVEQISTLIDFGGPESIRLFSGFRGSGKTTELLRLKAYLESQGYFVLYADALNYVNAAEPIDITDLLMVMAGAFSDALDERLGCGLASESFWERLNAFLQSEITFSEGSLKLDGETPFKTIFGGIKTGIDLKFQLKSATSFKKQLQVILANRLKDLKGSVDAFIESGIKKIHQAYGAETRVVFIFDQLEQLRGTLQTEQDVIRSVQRIFANNVDLLKVPYVHSIFTVPPWLKFVLPGTVQVTLLSTVHLWNNDDERSRNESAWIAFQSLIKRRLEADGLKMLFGDEQSQRAGVDALIAVCGGHMRDLLRLLRDVVIRANSLSSLPVSFTLVDHAINAGRRDFLPIAQDDAIWLHRIGELRAAALPSVDAEPVNRLARFLDSHYVLYFVNGHEWYDIHPLIRDDVQEIIDALKKSPEA